MTANRNLKRTVRARAARTGERYTAALRQVRRDEPDADAGPRRFRLAAAQSTVRGDPGDREGLRAAGEELRQLMRDAAAAGARLVHFPEGATCFPNKRVMSADGPGTVGPADWARADWDASRAELRAIAELARRLRLWTVVGAVHALTPPHRPHNSLYVVSADGVVATRYDERMLSRTKVSYLYSPGAAPVVFAVDGMRFGCALGLESHYPEIFTEYETRDVDCVLFSTTGGGPGDTRVMATQAQGHAAANGMWVSVAVSTEAAADHPCGVVGPRGNWLARGPRDGSPSVVVVDLDDGSEDAVEAMAHARPWRRRTRADAYDAARVAADPRSDERGTF
jgi:predicted amidohydrolase